MSSHVDREAVLYAFCLEPTHDRATLNRYLDQYPDLRDDLVDLSAELRLNETLQKVPPAGLPDPGAKAAWEEFIGCGPTTATGADLFDRYRGTAFAEMAKALDVPRSILTAIRDGLVVPSSIPNGFVRRLSVVAEMSVEAARASLSREREVPTGLAFKSSTKPAHQGQRTFRQVVLDTPVTDDQRALLLRECDEDERP